MVLFISFQKQISVVKNYVKKLCVKLGSYEYYHVVLGYWSNGNRVQYPVTLSRSEYPLQLLLDPSLQWRELQHGANAWQELSPIEGIKSKIRPGFRASISALKLTPPLTSPPPPNHNPSFHLYKHTENHQTPETVETSDDTVELQYHVC